MPSPSPVIVFDHPDKQFLPGEKITGYILIENHHKPRRARSVTITWRGTSKTKVCRQGSDGTTYWTSYTDYVLWWKQCLWKSKDGKNEMPIGIHELPFSYTLPKNCPPTLHASKAINKYTLEVVIDRPWRLNKTVEKEFSVTKKLEDLGPCNFNWIFNSGLFFNEGKIEVELHMPTKVFRPDEAARLHFTLTNNSRATLRRIDVLLYKRRHVHARPLPTPCEEGACPLKRDDFYTSHRQIGKKVALKLSLVPNATKCHDVLFLIPNGLTASFSTGLMSVGYYFKVRVEHSWATWSSTYFDVFIGEKDGAEYL